MFTGLHNLLLLEGRRHLADDFATLFHISFKNSTSGVDLADWTLCSRKEGSQLTNIGANKRNSNPRMRYPICAIVCPLVLICRHELSDNVSVV